MGLFAYFSLAFLIAGPFLTGEFLRAPHKSCSSDGASALHFCPNQFAGSIWSYLHCHVRTATAPPPQPPAFSGKVSLTRFCQFPSQGDSRTPSRVKPGVILSLPPGYQCLGLHAGSMPKGTSDMHLERKAMPCSGDHLHCFLIASSLAASNLFPLSKCISIPAPVPFPCPLTNPRSAADAFPVPEQVLKIGIVLTDG